MRVKTDCHTITGTATEIVKEFGKFILFDKKTSVDQYMTQVLKRLGSKKRLSGKTLEKRCHSFLKELEKFGDLKIL